MKYNIGISDRKPGGNSKKSNSFGLSRARIGNFASFSKARKAHNYRKFSRVTGGVRAVAQGSKSSRPVSRFAFFNKRPKLRKFVGKAFAIFAGLGLFFGAIGMIAVGLYLKNLQNSLPDPNKLVERSSDQSTILYDRKGKELYKIYADENRQFVKIEDIPEHTRWAVLAAEDVEFYQHKGMDWKGIARCGFLSLESYLSQGARGGLCGASTISQQLVRNTIAYDVWGDDAFDRSTFWNAAKRKLRELLLSMQVEQTLTKDELLQMYMNEVPLGGVNYGFQAAAKSYYGKDVKDLTLAESAMLSGIIQLPSVYSPLFGVQPELAKERQTYVLDQMLKHKDLTGVTEEEINAAKAEELVYKSADGDIKAYHFVFYVKQLLEEEFGADVVSRGGLRVTTTLDMSTQKIAEEEIKAGIKKYGHQWGVYNGAMLVLDPKTGQILSMVGSVDPSKVDDPRIDGNVNVTTSLRQVGSSFKPYVYLTAFQKYGPWLEAPDINTYDFGTYKPLNSDEKFDGLGTLRKGLIRSRNLPANYTLQLVGIENTIKTAEKLGITTLTSPQSYGLSMALGAAEMKLIEHAHAYTVFATGGIYRPSTAILKVENSDGEVLKEYKDTKGQRVVDEKEIYLLNWVLCNLGNFHDDPFQDEYFMIDGKRTICGKTGTTNGPKDLVAMQYHKNLLVAVWAGNNNGKEVPGAWSTTVPLPIAHSFMNRMKSKYKPELYTRPSGILAGTVCTDTGRLADKDTDCPKESTVYIEGRAPKKDERTKIEICEDTGKKSTNPDEARAYDLLKSKTLLNFELENSEQQKAYDKYVSSKLHYLTKEPESAACELPLGPNGEPIVDITSPSEGTTYNAGDVINVEAAARAKNGVNYIEFLFDGASMGSDNTAPYSLSFTIPADSSNGSHVITAKVVDVDNLTSTDSIAVTVNSTTSNQVTITLPGNGSNVVLPQAMNAIVAEYDAERVVFIVTSNEGHAGYPKSFTDTNGTDGWTQTWTDGSVQPGTYSIQARAVNNNANPPLVNSDLITVYVVKL